jgi:Holliday junction resolvase RusA-like endonuclease
MERLSFSFVVYGHARTKGSTKSFVPTDKKGNAIRTKGGRILVNTTHSGGTAMEAWQSQVAHQAGEAFAGHDILRDVPVTVFIDFFFLRPKLHFGSGKNAAKLKPSAPQWHIQKHGAGDIDKLERTVLDGMTGIVYADDAQVNALHAARHWTSEQPRAVITVAYGAETKRSPVT